MTISKQVELLNDLITKSRDAEEGYEEASKHVNDPQLKATLLEYSSQRFRFRNNLELALSDLNASPEEGNSVASNIHRAWMDLKSAIATNEDNAILNEVIRGEEYALETYQEVLKELPITASYYTEIVDQRNSIRSAIGHMRSLEIFSTV